MVGDAKAGEVASDLLSPVGLTEQVVVDRISGVAIDGYDPVAYFVDGAAMRGSESYEAIYEGAAWRFTNEGNRSAFLADPAVYMPQFGGYDANAVARGVATPGNPHLFLIAGERLLLFRTSQSREDFVSAPERLTVSEHAWPQIAQRLIR